MDHTDAASMQVLYDEHATALWRYALRLTGDRARAEDVVQETLLRAWQHPEVTDEYERSARAWLFTVARNMLIDETPSSRFRNEVSPADGSGAPEGADPDEVNTALNRLLIGDALAQLSAEHRAVVQRSYYQGWTTAQIADDLQIAEGTVKSRLHYALRALRHILQEMGITNDAIPVPPCALTDGQHRRVLAVGRRLRVGFAVQRRPSAIRGAPKQLPVMPRVRQ
jgi:RNA polymerase sigma-70 factor (ECF subfamily)